eukprot:GILJ01002987.1.p1 GENE.GILJ01002987.1~~GILJ01002987.1.p1  ORF type:complete len:393 (-),score=34.71 GILJ01002987.1:96-1274(-)
MISSFVTRSLRRMAPTLAYTKRVTTATKQHGRTIFVAATALGSAVGFAKLVMCEEDSYEVYDEGAPHNVIAGATLPVEHAVTTSAPHVPPPIKRKHAVLLKVDMDCTVGVVPVTHRYKYQQWRFGDDVPGPFIRARVGDVMELNLTNRDESGMPHNVDFHCVMGPGGGAVLTNVGEQETKTARFKLLYPGLYVYHCAAAPVPVHIANGMYGLILVEPAEGMPHVDKEYYVMQSEFYLDPPGKGSDLAELDYAKGLDEKPDVVVFNGREGALTEGKMLKAKTGQTVRIFFGNAGPNLISSFHMIGAIFDRVYRDGSLMSPPARGLQCAMTAPGSASIVEIKPLVPGNYTLVDHSIFRLDKGCVGFLSVTGHKRPDLFYSTEGPQPCVGCKLHA